MTLLNLPRKIYYKNGSTPVALRELSEVYKLSSAMLISDKKSQQTGHLAYVRGLLSKEGLRVAELTTEGQIPTVQALMAGLPKVLEFQPQVLVGLGNSPVMSFTKALWALYENPSLDLELAAKEAALLQTGAVAKMVLIATDFATGGQTSTVAVVQETLGKLFCLNSRELLPEIAVTDAYFLSALSLEEVEANCLRLDKLLSKALAAPGCDDYLHSLLAEAREKLELSKNRAYAGSVTALEALHNAGALAGCGVGHLFTPKELVEILD